MTSTKTSVVDESSLEAPAEIETAIVTNVESKDSELESNDDNIIIDIDSIANKFVNTYYEYFASDRSKLEKFYREPSCLSFEGQGYQGLKKIMNKLRNLPIKSIEHNTQSVDTQPSGCGGLMIFITGDLKIDHMTNAVHFTQSLHIIPLEENPTQFWIQNDIFRLQI